ncbi:MAG: PfkB family carbohydrate kinase [Paracoccus sp. (in: a-proteobacteria)]
MVPASPGKAGRLAPLIETGRGCFYLSPLEGEIIAGHPCADAVTAAEAVVARGARRVIVTDGGERVADAMAGQPTLTVTPPAVRIARITGAGDCFLAAHLVAEQAGGPREAALQAATRAAAAHVAGKDLP